MGTQFWWFFDAAAAAIMLVSVYLSGRKGFSKSIAVMIGYVLALLLAAPLSGGTADFIYEKSVRESNISSIGRALENNSITKKTKSYIEGLGYNVTVDEGRLSEILTEDRESGVYAELYKYVNNINGRVVDEETAFTDKMQEGFAGIMKEILSEELTGYEAESASEKILTGKQVSFEKDLSTLCREDTRAAAELIEKQYTADATKDIIRIFCFITIIFVLMIIVRMIAQKLSDGEAIRPIGDITDHVAGGVLGAAEGAVIIFLTAAAVRAMVILGNNEMLLFNSETIDKTIIFKHIYDLVLKL